MWQKREEKAQIRLFSFRARCFCFDHACYFFFVLPRSFFGFSLASAKVLVGCAKFFFIFPTEVYIDLTFSPVNQGID
jgi:hypothetical protein